MQFFRPLDPRKVVWVDREWLRVLLPKCSLLDVSPRKPAHFLTLGASDLLLLAYWMTLTISPHTQVRRHHPKMGFGFDVHKVSLKGRKSLCAECDTPRFRCRDTCFIVYQTLNISGYGTAI